MYSWLNQLCVTLSYTGVLKVVTELSKLHKVPLSTWLQSGVPVKLVGNNVDKKKGVRDIRSNHRGELVHMYSLLAVKGRVPIWGSKHCTWRRFVVPEAILISTYRGRCGCNQTQSHSVGWSNPDNLHQAFTTPLQGTTCPHTPQFLCSNGSNIWSIFLGMY